MRTPPIVVAAILGFSASAFAQTPVPKATAAPKAAGKPHKPPAGPMDCKLVGTVRGPKIWAGDCIAAEPAAETPQTAPPPPPRMPLAEKQ